MNFYEDIAHRLYLQNTTIGPTRLQWKDFIEAMQDKAEFKGVTYYSNLISAMPNHFGANLYPDIFKETLQYCKEKIDDLQKVKESKNQAAQWSDLVDPFMKNRLIEVEDKAVVAEKAPVSQWTKIRIAAFVETMFDKKWFIERTNRIKAANEFSKARYGVNVETQLQSSKAKDRESNKNQLKKHF